MICLSLLDVLSGMGFKERNDESCLGILSGVKKVMTETKRLVN